MPRPQALFDLGPVQGATVVILIPIVLGCLWALWVGVLLYSAVRGWRPIKDHAIETHNDRLDHQKFTNSEANHLIMGDIYEEVRLGERIAQSEWDRANRPQSPQQTINDQTRAYSYTPPSYKPPALNVRSAIDLTTCPRTGHICDCSSQGKVYCIASTISPRYIQSPNRTTF